jgi:hypothetical protein
METIYPDFGPTNIFILGWDVTDAAILRNLSQIATGGLLAQALQPATALTQWEPSAVATVCTLTISCATFFVVVAISALMSMLAPIDANFCIEQSTAPGAAFRKGNKVFIACNGVLLNVMASSLCFDTAQMVGVMVAYIPMQRLVTRGVTGLTEPIQVHMQQQSVGLPIVCLTNVNRRCASLILLMDLIPPSLLQV